MRRALLLAILMMMLTMTGTLLAQGRNFRGTVVRMSTTQCMPQHGFMATMSGQPPMVAQGCPEYIVVSDKVVYVIVGRKPDEFIPLAEEILFRVRKGEVLVLSDDEKEQSRFNVRQMVLRPEWDRAQARREMMMQAAERSLGDARGAQHNMLLPASSEQ